MKLVQNAVVVILYNLTLSKITSMIFFSFFQYKVALLYILILFAMMYLILSALWYLPYQTTNDPLNNTIETWILLCINLENYINFYSNKS